MDQRKYCPTKNFSMVWEFCAMSVGGPYQFAMSFIVLPVMSHGITRFFCAEDVLLMWIQARGLSDEVLLTIDIY